MTALHSASMEKPSFDDEFDIDELLAEGTFGDVSKCRENATGKYYAVKIKKKKKLHEEDEVDLEMSIWRSVDHNHIVHFHRGFESTEAFYLVLEYVHGGNLLDEIIRRTNYSERDACVFIAQTLAAVEYLHSNRIVHRDIKPDNILLLKSGNGQTCLVKLTDFGLARRIPKDRNDMTFDPSGAPLYMAPETILEEPISFNVDVWSCAIVLHLILVGFPPFWDEDDHKLFQQIVRANVHFTASAWESISVPAQDLLRRMLVSEPSKRLSAKDCLLHPWIKEVDELSDTHRDEAQTEIQRFRARLKFRGAVMIVAAGLKLLKLHRASVNCAKALNSACASQKSSGAGQV